MIFRVLVVGEDPASEEWAEQLRGDGWETQHVGFAKATAADAAFNIHATVIDITSRPELGASTAWALRSIPIPATDLARYPNLPVLFVGADDRWRRTISTHVPGATFVSESEIPAALTDLKRTLHTALGLPIAPRQPRPGPRRPS